MVHGHRNNKVLIRADGSKEIGMGHMYRCVRLARFLRDRHKVESIFVMEPNEAARILIKSEAFDFHTLKPGMTLARQMCKVTEIAVKESAAVVIVDLLENFGDDQCLKAYREAHGGRLIVFNDGHEKEFVQADIVINSSPLGVSAGRRFYGGFKYLILPVEYSAKRPLPRTKETVSRVTLCMGGSDHNDLTYRVLKAIDRSPLKFRWDVVVSSVYFKRKDMNGFIKGLAHDVDVHYDVNGLLPLLKKSDMAITAGGYSQIERMAAGIPGIVISQLKHQEEYTQYIHHLGGCVHLGFHEDIGDDVILKNFERLFNDATQRRNISRMGKRLIDGKGLERVARIVLQSLPRNHVKRGNK